MKEMKNHKIKDVKDLKRRRDQDVEEGGRSCSRNEEENLIE